ncbi:MAG: AAA family ATPase, partial [bacterium]
MDKFAKTILNYFAAYTETRFRFDKKIEYFWTDNELTCDLSVFPDFQNKLLEQIQSGTPFNFNIARGEYSIELKEDKFRKTLLETLNSSYNIEYLKNCIKQELENFRKQYGDKTILISDGKSSERKDRNKDNKEKEDPVIPQFQNDWRKKSFLEGTRKYNNAYAHRVVHLLTKLQEEKLHKLKVNLNIKHFPTSSFNPHQIRQQIFSNFQKIAQDTLDNISEEKYFEGISKFIQEESFNLVLYDLYAVLRQFKIYIPVGNVYLFFHEMLKQETDTKKNGNKSNNKKQSTSKYPIFLVETNIEEKEEKINVQSVRDIVIINTPAINSLAFENIITTPRAARFGDSFTYLNQVQKHIQDLYNFYEPFLFNQNYPTLSKEKYPEITFRIGFQIVQKENRKLLDYSELITHIDAGKGDKFIDMIKNYVSGNVENTTGEVDTKYREKYPRKSVNNILSTIPLSLNAPQKRILTAIENEKNKVVVVDGPPGTGKSYTIAAITYWANQKNKSVVVTSHKKAALDVIDQMMTDQFKKLHPESKPSIIRLSQDGSSINRYNTTLATQYISSATQRRNTYQEEAEAVKKDIENTFQEIKKQNDLYWKSSDEYENYITNLYKFEKIRNKLILKGIISEDEYPVKIPADEEINLDSVKKLSIEINKLGIDGISLQEINEIYKHKSEIDEWLAVCQDISDLSLKEEEINNLLHFDSKDLNSFQKRFQDINKKLKNSSPIFVEKGKLRYASIIKQLQLKNNNDFHQQIKELNRLEYDNIIKNICILSAREKNELSVEDIDKTINKLFQISQFKANKKKIDTLLEITNKRIDNIKEVFDLLRKLKSLFEKFKPQTAQSFFILERYFANLLNKIGIDFGNIRTIANLFSETEELPKQIFEYLYYFIELSKNKINQLPDKKIIEEYNQTLYKDLLAKNDERTKNLNNFTSNIERIKTSLDNRKRLSLEESKILLENISCIISEPDLISQYFPMEENLIDLLI